MKVTNDKTENCQAFLTIEMEPAEMEESLEGSFKRLGKSARVPGFRKGKAPRDILERYIGRDHLLEDAVNEMLPRVYDQAIKEQEIDAIAQPEIEIAQIEPVIIKAVVPLRPSVKIKDYQSIRVTLNEEKVTKKNIDDVIHHLQHQYATWEPVERPVELNDMVVFDVESTVEDKPFLSQQGAQYQVSSEQTFPAPGFTDKLVGMKKDDEKEFKLELPADYQQEELAGKEAAFKVKVLEIKQEILPELNDDFAKQVNPDLDNMTDLRENATIDMKARADERARIDFEERVIDAVVDLSEVEFPPVMVESEINRTINQSFQGNNRSLEDYLRNMNKTEEELRDEIRPSATKTVTRSLVLGKIAEDDKIDIGEDEIDIEIDNMTNDAAPDKKDELKTVMNTPQVRESIERTLVTRKTVQLLTDIAGNSAKTKKVKPKASKANTETKKQREKEEK
ncbi:MAG: trigger factor [Dehalococcoidales bacterium]